LNIRQLRLNPRRSAGQHKDYPVADLLASPHFAAPHPGAPRPPDPRAEWSPAARVPLPDLFAIITEYIEAGRLDAALRLLGHLLASHPDLPDALHLQGLISYKRGDLDRAIALMERSLTAGAVKSIYYRNISEVYRLRLDLDAALAAAQRAIALDPADPLGPFNLAMVHYDRMELPHCVAAARHALALRPDLPQAHMKLAQALLLGGAFAEGWAEYEWRYRIPGAQPLMPDATARHFAAPPWDGRPLPGQRLLLIADQGFGDVVMFARYIGWAKRRCPRLTLACSSDMLPVLRALYPTIPTICRWDDTPPHAAFCPLSGLPRLHGTRLHGTRLDRIPPATPSLRANPIAAATWRARLDAHIPPGQLRVGLAWAGRPTHANDHHRSTHLAALAPLADIPGITLVSLQKGPAAAQAAQFPGLIDITADLTDFADTIAMIDGLDLVITVDTAIAHIAGAMARPTWVMLPFAPDWRWLTTRQDSPWYPSLRLFRHPAPRRWDLVAAELAVQLNRYLANGGQNPVEGASL
jgi:hypothetical protein